jgi:hypothetical protein
MISLGGHSALTDHTAQRAHDSDASITHKNQSSNVGTLFRELKDELELLKTKTERQISEEACRELVKSQIRCERGLVNSAVCERVKIEMKARDRAYQSDLKKMVSRVDSLAISIDECLDKMKKQAGGEAKPNQKNQWGQGRQTHLPSFAASPRSGTSNNERLKVLENDVPELHTVLKKEVRDSWPRVLPSAMTPAIYFLATTLLVWHRHADIVKLDSCSKSTATSPRSWRTTRSSQQTTRGSQQTPKPFFRS